MTYLVIDRVTKRSIVDEYVQKRTEDLVEAKRFAESYITSMTDSDRKFSYVFVVEEDAYNEGNYDEL